MQCIDFDERFSHYVTQWMDRCREDFRNMDAMEAQMPDVYMKWLNAPADWLNGETPGMYFVKYDDAGMLIDWLNAYAREGVPVPEPLTQRISELGGNAADALIDLAGDDHALIDARMTALSIIGEIQPTSAIEPLIDIICASESRELSDAAADALFPLGSAVIDACLGKYLRANNHAKENFLDVLCNFSGDKRIYPLLEDAFLSWHDKRALLASYMGKLGDERAIPCLKEAAQWEDMCYLDFLEIRSAIEELGGEPEPDRDFTGDSYYESLKKMG